MDLWIRSQNKNSLTKITCVYISDDDGNGEYIMGTVDIKGHILLGRYRSKKRALEIIDEIQKVIKPSIITTNYECEIKENPTDKLSFNLDMNPQKTEVIEMNTYVYEMPEE